MIKVNGTERNYTKNQLLLDFIEKEGYKKECIAVEINGEIVPKAEYGLRILKDNDTIEVVSFVGGG